MTTADDIIARWAVAQMPPGERIEALCFPEQRELVFSHSRRCVAYPGRRGGKTHASALLLLRAMLQYNRGVARYLTLKREQARVNFWPVLKSVAEVLGLVIEYDDQRLQARVGNARLVVSGADEDRLVDRLRGASCTAVVVDEAASFDDLTLQNLCESVIWPSLADNRGRLVVTGTPGYTLAGYFYEIGRLQHWERHHWTMAHNPNIEDGAGLLAEEREAAMRANALATYRREWLGEWCFDAEGAVYNGFDPERCTVDGLPDFEVGILDRRWRHVLGVDIGFEDATAFVAVAYHPNVPVAYVVEAEAVRHELPSAGAERLVAWRNRYRPSQIVADYAAKGILEEWKDKFRLYIEPAAKTEKAAAIQVVNGDFLDGRVKVLRSCTEYVEQLQRLTWKDKGKTETPGQPNDLCDAALYALRSSRHHWFRQPAPLVEIGSKQWSEKQIEAARRRVLARRPRDWWNQGE